MEHKNHQKSTMLMAGKRKRTEEGNSSSSLSLDELNQDLLERILSWVPPSTFFRLRSVCKRWRSVATSATFRIACSQIPLREPWFLMVGSDLNRLIVYDSSEKNWKNLNHPCFLKQAHGLNPIPVASSDGLVCFRTVSGKLIVSNPVTGACRELPPATPVGENQTIHAIAMKCYSKDAKFYKVVMVSGEFPNLSSNVYDSSRDCWVETILYRRPCNLGESETAGDDPVYFLSKTGDVVATNMIRSPWKQYSSVMTVEGGEGMIYFLSPTGAMVASNLHQRSFFEFPRLLPVNIEHSLDVVECKGEIFLVVLSDFLESSSLRVWKFSKPDQSWVQVASMPPAMSHEFYGKKADVNCVGFRDTIFICLNSNDFNGVFICDLATGEWSELPKCCLSSEGEAEEFMSAFSFEPRIEACV